MSTTGATRRNIAQRTNSTMRTINRMTTRVPAPITMRTVFPRRVIGNPRASQAGAESTWANHAAEMLTRSSDSVSHPHTQRIT
jgi:hypothetical protein